MVSWLPDAHTHGKYLLWKVFRNSDDCACYFEWSIETVVATKDWKREASYVSMGLSPSWIDTLGPPSQDCLSWHVNWTKFPKGGEPALMGQYTKALRIHNHKVLTLEQ